MVDIMGRQKYHYRHRRSGGADIHVGSSRTGETIETTMVTVGADGTVEVEVDSTHVPSGRVTQVLEVTYTGDEGALEADHYIREMRYRHARR